MPSVSVIIPFYNRIDWLIEAVHSVLAQSYSDFEVIIVNDGSTEKFNPFDVFDDDRIRYVVQENRGPAAARNVGISTAQGKYVAFLDADDLFEPQKLAVQVLHMEENPGVVFSHTSYARISVSGEFIETVDSGRFSGDVYPGIIAHCPIATPTVMVCRDVLNSLKFVENVRVGEDIMLWLRIAKLSKVLGINKVLSKVRIHGANAAFNPEIVLEANLKIIDYAYRYDTSLKTLFRLRSISRIYYYVSSLYFNSKEKHKAFQHIFKAIVCYPIRISNYVLFVYFTLPESLRLTLRRMKIYLRPTKE